MIPNRNSDTAVVSTVQGEDVAMSIDTSALAHIMNVLTDLYSDPEAAVIREYSTNALDSHIEAGVSDPIRVTLPTALRPTFTVRDYGVGLSAEGIRDIYSRYGASTKRETNDAVGMLGLGCKSALAYTDSFTLVGIVDGHRWEVSIARDETGAGTMSILAEEPTDEPNGVEVSVPVKSGNLFEYKAAEFFANWAPGTVLVNGQPPEPCKGWQIGENFLIEELAHNVYSDADKLRVVMGNVSYPVPADYAAEALAALPSQRRLVARVPIGTVQFAPSRETLQDHPSTRAALDGALVEFREAVEAEIKRTVSEADSKPKAAQALLAARTALGDKNVVNIDWQGEEIPAKISMEYETWVNGPKQTYRPEGQRIKVGEIDFNRALRSVWVLNYTNANFSKTQRRKLNRYMEENGLSEGPSEETVILTKGDSVPMTEWIDGTVRELDWATVRTWKDPNRPANTGGGSRGAYAGTYAVQVPSGYYSDTFPAEEIDQSVPIYYVSHGCELGEAFRAVLGDCYLAYVPEPRLAKFKRLFPKAKPARPAAEKAAARWYKRLGKRKQEAVRVGPHCDNRGFFDLVKLGEIRDPELKQALRATRLYGDDLRREHEAAARFNTDIPESPEVWEALAAKYPLLPETYYTTTIDVPHCTIYINAVHAATKRKD